MKLKLPITKSNMALVKACPLRAETIFREGRPPDVLTPALIEGRAVHEALALTLPSGTIPADVMFGPDEIRFMVETALRFRRWQNIQTEVRYNFELDMLTTRYPCTVILDCISKGDRVLMVEEFKSGKPWVDEFERDLYVYAASRMFPDMLVFEFAYRWLRYETEDLTRYDHLAVRGLQKKLISMVDAVNDIEPLPTPGHHCTWCHMTERCPAQQNITTEIAPEVFEWGIP